MMGRGCRDLARAEQDSRSSHVNAQGAYQLDYQGTEPNSGCGRGRRD